MTGDRKRQANLSSKFSGNSDTLVTPGMCAVTFRGRSLLSHGQKLGANSIDFINDTG